jgi:hypothetical protein
MFSAMTLLLLLIAVIGLVWLWVTVARQPTVHGATCGRCGYRVEGLEKMACPECGGDFRQVGITTPRHKEIRPVRFIVLWTLLLGVPAAVMSATALRMGPRILRVTTDLTLASSVGTIPKLALRLRSRGMVGPGPGSRRAFGSTGVAVDQLLGPEGTTTTIRFPVMSGVASRSSTAELSRTGDSSRSPLSLALDSGSGSAVDVEKLETWLGSLTAGAAEVELAAEAAELAGLIDAYANQRPHTIRRLTLGSGVSSQSVSVTPLWYKLMLAAAGVGVYAAGITLYAVIRRRCRAAIPSTIAAA